MPQGDAWLTSARTPVAMPRAWGATARGRRCHPGPMLCRPLRVKGLVCALTGRPPGGLSVTALGYTQQWCSCPAQHEHECCVQAYLQALIMAPRVTWDNKAMQVYSTLHPEVLAYRKVGEPSVQIRARSAKRS
jgi:hypothetical protein